MTTSNHREDFAVSGEPTEIVLVADDSGAMATLLVHLGEVDQAGLTDWALIEGLAVMVRLEDAHRPPTSMHRPMTTDSACSFSHTG